MLSDQELEVVGKARISGFAAYLHGAYGMYELVKRKIEMGALPSTEELTKIREKMELQKKAFDIVYFMDLLESPVNPLAEEQQMWMELAPRIQGFLDDFGEWMKRYNPSTQKAEEKDSLMPCLDKWRSLMGSWNEISDRYKPKVEEWYNYLRRRGIHKIQFESASDKIEARSKKK